MSMEWKQDHEDWVWVARDRKFGGKVAEVLRMSGDPVAAARVSVAGVPLSYPLQKANAVILSAALKTMHSTPVQVIPAPSAGSYIEIVSVHGYLKFNSAAYDSVDASDFLELRYTDGSGALLTATVSPVGFGDAVADAHVIIAPASSGWVPANARVVAFIGGSEWYAAAGDGDLHLEILYRVRPLAI